MITRQVGFIFINVILGVVLLYVLLWGALNWRLSYGGIPFSPLIAPVQSIVSDILRDQTVLVGGVSIKRFGWDDVIISLKDVVVHSGEGDVLIMFSEVNVALLKYPLLIGQIRPLSFEVIGTEIAFIYNRKGYVHLGMNEVMSGETASFLSRGSRIVPDGAGKWMLQENISFAVEHLLSLLSSDGA
ncbi:MAG: hypothetical protein PSN37_03815, partial [Alphaproteobacteria bacterium]|nr:hypothetical protein [Alphaproteobacteria bacterium]